MRTAVVLTLSLVLLPGIPLWSQEGVKKTPKPLPSNPQILQKLLKEGKIKIDSLQQDCRNLTDQIQVLANSKEKAQKELQLATAKLAAAQQGLQAETEAHKEAIRKSKAALDAHTNLKLELEKKLIQKSDLLAKTTEELKAAQKAQQLAENEIAKARAAVAGARDEAAKQLAEAIKQEKEAQKQLAAALKARDEALKAVKNVNVQPEPKEVDLKAICVITPFVKGQAHGIVKFHQKGDTVTITGEITGLKPGEHGFHVHQFGDISGKDGLTTGGHYNPTKKEHGKPTDKNRHVGDLGNITADKEGKAVINMKDTVIRLNGPHSIIGRAVIIHHDADDFGQPVGHAGARSGGGVIGIAK